VAHSKEQTSKGSLIELISIVAVALGLALAIQAFLVKPFRIPSESMVPTLQVGQRVLVDRVSPRFGDPSRGDILVFKPPAGADTNSCGVRRPSDQACPTPTRARSSTNFIKRVVGLSGDRISIVDGRVRLNGRIQREAFIRPDAQCPTCNLPTEIVVPPDHVFMMGDNRGESADSREWGPIPEEWIIGNTFFTYWPPKRIGPL
jgi:signal peptidase I